jgi:hypothetical protein
VIPIDEFSCRVAIMRPNHPHCSSILLALLCGAWAAIGPVLPQIHQAYAGHRHVFCTDDSRIEDVEVVETPAWVTAKLAAPHGQNIVGGALLVSASWHGGTECLCSNFTGHAILLDRAGLTAGYGAPAFCVRPDPVVLSLAVDRFRIAPKNSPPIGG